MEVIEIFKAIILGIIEGITEWLPISSTGHMILVDEFLQLGMSDAFKEMFFVVIQLGAIMAVVLLYWKKIFPFNFNKKPFVEKDIIIMWIKIVLACIPAAIIGLKWDDQINALFYNFQTVAIMLILFGILFIVVENHNKGKTPKINNRIFAIDMNPNYIGWSIVEWKSSSVFRIVKEGIISIKELNDYDNKQKIDSTKRKHISNIRHHAVIEICKNLVDTAIYYRCDKFVLEDLKFNTSGSYNKLNRLTRNQWCRDLLENNIIKRCNIYNINVIKVKPEYSSFIGNFIFRQVTDMPDMVLASIEIGRRGYEYSSQYIDKTKNKKKNIVFPDISDFNDFYTKSLEEFSIKEKPDSMLTLYSYIKNTKMTYRVPISNKLVGFRLRSVNRFVYKINKLM